MVASTEEGSSSANITGDVNGQTIVMAGYEGGESSDGTQQNAPEGPVANLDVGGDVNGQVIVVASEDGEANVSIAGKVSASDLDYQYNLPDAAVVVGNGYTYDEHGSMHYAPAGTANVTVGGIETDEFALYSVTASDDGEKAVTNIAVNGDVSVTSDGKWGQGILIETHNENAETDFSLEKRCHPFWPR